MGSREARADKKRERGGRRSTVRTNATGKFASAGHAAARTSHEEKAAQGAGRIKKRAKPAEKKRRSNLPTLSLCPWTRS